MAESRHAASAAKLDVVAAEEIVLAVVLPPGHVKMHAADPIVIVRGHAFQLWEISGAVAADRIRQVSAYHVRRVGQTVRKYARSRVQQQPRRLAGAGSDDECLRANTLLGPRILVDVRDRFDLAVFADDEFPRHRARDQGEMSRLLSCWKHDLAGTEIRGCNTSAPALAAIVARGPAVVLLGQNCEACGNTGDMHPVTSLLDQQFGASRLGWRQENTIGCTGHIFPGAEDSYVGFHFVVVGSDLVVGDRPVVAHAVGGASF